MGTNKFAQWAERRSENNSRPWAKFADLREAWREEREAWKLGKPEPRERRHTTPGDSLQTLGVIAAAIGAWLMYTKSADYSACQSVFVRAANWNLCQSADTAHQAGIILLIGGAVLFIAGTITKNGGNQT